MSAHARSRGDAGANAVRRRGGEFAAISAIRALQLREHDERVHGGEVPAMWAEGAGTNL